MGKSTLTNKEVHNDDIKHSRVTQRCTKSSKKPTHWYVGRKPKKFGSKVDLEQLKHRKRNFHKSLHSHRNRIEDWNPFTHEVQGMKFNYLLLPKKGNQLPLEKRYSENNMKTKVTSYRAILRKKNKQYDKGN